MYNKHMIMGKRLESSSEGGGLCWSRDIYRRWRETSGHLSTRLTVN